MRAAPKVGVLVGAVAAVVAIGVWLFAAPPSKPVEPSAGTAPRKPAVEIPAPDPTPSRPPALDAAVPQTAQPPHLAPKKVTSSKPKLLTEAELLEKLRKAQDTDDYVLSYELAREGQRRFPDSPDAPEIAAMVVKSLARQGKASEARAEAETMVNKYPGTHWAREVERHTGAHPHVNQVPPQ